MAGKRKFIVFIGIALLAVKASAQQTIQFSQYTFNGLAINPAYAGYKDNWTVNLSSRFQWVGINGAPQTETASVDGVANTDNSNVGLGLIVTNDRLGPESTTSAYANYAYRLQLDESDTRRLCFGIGAGVMQYSLNGSALIATDAGDADIPAGSVSKITPDVRFGLYYYSPSFYVGASAFNLLSSTLVNTTNNAPIVSQVRTFYLTAGAMLPLSDGIDAKPSFMVKEDFKGPTNLDLTNYFVFDKLVWVGASYRTGVAAWNKSNLQSSLENQDAVAAIAQISVSDNFRIGYSYDFTLTKLANYQSGSHELSISISFPNKKQRVISPRYF